MPASQPIKEEDGAGPASRTKRVRIVVHDGGGKWPNMAALKPRSCTAALAAAWTFLCTDRGCAWFLYCCAFAGLGLCLSTLGPVLLDISVQTSSPLAAVGYCFAVRSVGYALGSTGGALYDRLPGHAVLGTAVIIAGAGTLLIPAVQSVAGLSAAVIFQGIGMGFCDTGANVMTIWWFGVEMGPFMQALHFAFALGATLGPFFLRALARPVLDLDTGEPLLGRGAYASAFYLISAINILIGLALYIRRSPKPRTTHAEEPSPQAPSSSKSSEGALASGEGQGVGLMHSGPADASPVGIDCAFTPTVLSNTFPSVVVPQPHAASLWYLVLLIAIMLFLYVGAETGYGAYVTAYAVLGLHQSEAEGQFLAGLYWAAICVGRFASIFTSSMIAPGQLLGIAMAGSAASSLLLLIFARNATAVWLFTVAFGLSMACIFPTALALAETYFPVQGVHATAFVVGAAAGEVLLPFIIATLFGSGVDSHGHDSGSGGGSTGSAGSVSPYTVGPSIMMWVVAAGCIAQFAMFQVVVAYGPKVAAKVQIRQVQIAQAVAAFEAKVSAEISTTGLNKFSATVEGEHLSVISAGKDPFGAQGFRVA